jgi:hypothetical protein
MLDDAELDAVSGGLGGIKFVYTKQDAHGGGGGGGGGDAGPAINAWNTLLGNYGYA